MARYPAIPPVAAIQCRSVTWPRRTSVAVGLSGVLVPTIAALTVAGASPEMAGGVSLVARSERFVQLVMLEAGLVLLWAPLAGIFLVSNRTRRSRSAVHLAGTMTIAATLVAVTAVALATLLRAPLDGTTLGVSHVALWAEAFACLALGSFCGVYAGDALDAAAFALAAAVAAAAAVFVAGPLLTVLPARAIDVLLDVSPVVGVAAAAGVDIFRTGVLYQVSPLAHMQMRYPDPTIAIGAYVALGLLLVVGVALRFGGPDFSLEGNVQ